MPLTFDIIPDQSLQINSQLQLATLKHDNRGGLRECARVVVGG